MEANANTQVTSNKLHKVAFIHYALILAYVANIIVYDAWRLAAPDLLSQRWIAVGLLSVTATVAWYFSRNVNLKNTYYKSLAFLLIVADILFAAYNVYLQRGVSSKAVILFVIPIIVAALLANLGGVMATAVLSATAYIVAAALYANQNPSEGYKIELYGEIFYYSAVLLLAAWLLWTVRKNL